MNNRKNYNSILFLTVYLGLVLVGGSSHVFAYAATNSLFDIRNEIEFKEDLDNKPDDSCAELKAKVDEKDNQFIDEYINFISTSVKRYSSGGGFSYIDGYGGVVRGNIFPSLRKDISFGDFDFAVNNDGLHSNADFRTNSSNGLANFASSLAQSFYFKRCSLRDLPKKVIFQGTSVSFTNNQVFIVTRLPRGSIDSLLK